MVAPLDQFPERRFSGQRVHSWVCQKAWLLSKSFCKDSSLSGILMTCLTNWPPVFTNRSGLLDESATARPGADRIVGHFHLGKSCAMKVASLPWVVRQAAAVVLRMGCRSRCTPARGPAEQLQSWSGLVNQFAKFLARLEKGNSLRRHFDWGSGLWITPDARSSLARVEASESADFHLVPGSQCPDDAVQYRANDDVGFLEGHPNGLVNLFGQIGPVHLAQRNVRCTANRHIYFPRGYQWWLSVLHRRRRGMDVAQELRPEGSRHPRPFLQIRSEDAAGNVA
jgi:hypothetical protein